MPVWMWGVGIISTVLLAIGGGIAKLMSVLIGKYFQSLSDRMGLMENNLQNHTVREELYQNKMTDLMADLRDSLIRLETGRELFASKEDLNNGLRRVEQQVIDSRHTLREEVQRVIMQLEVKIERKADKE